MSDCYKTMKIKDAVYSRLITYQSKIQLSNGGHRITLCEAITRLLDIAETKDKN